MAFSIYPSLQNSISLSKISAQFDGAIMVLEGIAALGWFEKSIFNTSPDLSSLDCSGLWRQSNAEIV